MGRGGSGKTSSVALMTKYFIEKSATPLLLVDVDPDQNLGEMVGIDLKEQGKNISPQKHQTHTPHQNYSYYPLPPCTLLLFELWMISSRPFPWRSTH